MPTTGPRRRARAATAALRAAPWWTSVLLGLVCLLLGLLLTTRPLTSLSALGLLIGLAAITAGAADLLAAYRSQAGAAATATALAWIGFGIVVLAWLGRALDLLAPAVALALVVGGALRLVRAVRGDLDERLTTIVLGLADIVFGVLAWRWPDVTLLVVAFLFGIRTVFFGLARIGDGLAALGGRTPDPTAPAPRRTPARYRRPAVAVLALLVAVAAAGVAVRLRAGSPVVDAFYTAPDQVPDHPGALLRAEPFTRAVPDGAEAWRILYTTTRDDDQPAVASALVVVAKNTPPGPRPVIAWAHGTTGFAEPCAPTLLDDPLGAGALPAESALLDRGWVLVATDYVGLGTAGPHPYLIGQGEGRSVLDAVRAAHQLDDLDLADDTVVWGHSQGGHAALWAGLLAPTYAPDTPVAGVAAMAPASDTVALTTSLDTVPGGSVFASYVLAAYTAVYDDVDGDTYIRPAARTLVREMATRCLSEPAVYVSVLSALSLTRDRPVLRTDPTTGPLGRRLAENVPTGPMTVPVLLAQGATDPLVTAAVQDRYVRDRCAENWALDYRSYPGRDHLGLVAEDSPLLPDLLTWTEQRLAGTAAPGTCPGR
ncbi:lipase family protein [Rhodococcus sp. GXMU-t2271]|uniref:lipase family protein n=1 Tax=Rhodococcus sp. GXMU-t2271 TaxID=3059079 RepID=UPI00352A20D6